MLQVSYILSVCSCLLMQLLKSTVAIHLVASANKAYAVRKASDLANPTQELFRRLAPTQFMFLPRHCSESVTLAMHHLHRTMLRQLDLLSPGCEVCTEPCNKCSSDTEVSGILMLVAARQIIYGTNALGVLHVSTCSVISMVNQCACCPYFSLPE